jgi:hypothetical protein
MGEKCSGRAVVASAEGEIQEEIAEGNTGFQYATTDVIYRVHNPRSNAEEGNSMLSCPDKSIMNRGS